MAVLHHHPFCPHSRFIRLALAEMGVQPELQEERPWERRIPFLEMNPAGTIPILVDDGGAVVPGASVIAEYLDEARGPALGTRRLLPHDIFDRVEVRRLLDWFLGKFHEEVTGYLVTEKIYKRFMTAEQGGGPPDMQGSARPGPMCATTCAISATSSPRANGWRGDQLTYADLAAAAHLSVADYLGDVPWDENETARNWYARVKSRPSFRALLNDRVPGMAAAEHYPDLDF